MRRVRRSSFELIEFGRRCREMPAVALVSLAPLFRVCFCG